MKSIEYKARSGAIQYKPTLTEQQFFNASENYTGFCLACGKTQGETEPDARKYTCNGCNKPKVYGLEELMIIGLINLI